MRLRDFTYLNRGLAEDQLLIVMQTCVGVRMYTHPPIVWYLTTSLICSLFTMYTDCIVW